MQCPNLKSLLKKTMISHLQDKLESVESAVKRWRHDNEIDEESSTSKFLVAMLLTDITIHPFCSARK